MTEPNTHYLLVARDDRFWLVGPFDSQKAAGDWGADFRTVEHADHMAHTFINNPGDDPRWQTIQLAAVPAGVEVRSPDAGPMESP